MGKLRDALLLVRAPLAATVAGDAVAGYVLALPERANGRDPIDAQALGLAVAASACLYWAGMALNDFFDRHRDRAIHPHRPLPSGRVAPRTAAVLGAVLLAAGVGLAALAGGARSALTAAGVAAAVLLYDGLLKRARLPGALGMALCRGGNVYLAATVASAIPPLGAVRHALALACYVFALTLLSTYEDEDAPPLALAAGFGGALASAMVYGATLPSAAGWLCLAPFGLLLAWRLGAASREGTKASGRATTRWLLRGLLLLDSGALLGVHDHGTALGVLCLFAPYLLGAKALLGPPPAAAKT